MINMEVLRLVRAQGTFGRGERFVNMLLQLTRELGLGRVRLVAVKPDHTSEPPGGRVGFRHMILGGHKHLAHTELTSRWFSFHLSDLLDVKTPDVGVFESVVFQPFSLTCVLSIGAGFTQPKHRRTPGPGLGPRPPLGAPEVYVQRGISVRMPGRYLEVNLTRTKFTVFTGNWKTPTVIKI